MQVIVKKWGNSAAVRIPAHVLDASHLALETPVDVRAEDGRIIIEPIRSQKYDLEKLLAAITPENLHAEADFGHAVGKESL